MERLAAEGRLISVEDVALELQGQEDDVSEWAESHKDIFLKLTQDIQLQTRSILKDHPKLVDLKRKKSSADPFLIATAMVKRGVVVTEERKSGGPQVEKIPDVCAAYRLPCISLLKLLEQEGLPT
jgi:hypothetical protein